MSKKPKNPKSLRTARKYGWNFVKVKRQDALSWVGITIAVDRMTKGRRVQAYGNDGGGTMAFENEADALMVTLKFG